MAKRRKPRKTARIYYGVNAEGDKLYWTVPVTDAKKSVEISSTLLDALTGKAGVTIGCHLSNCARRNSAVFPHACKFASFTKGACLIIDKIKNGQPAHAFRYVHRMGHLVELNDRDVKKVAIRKDPSLAERSITLYAPYQYASSDRGQTRGGRRELTGTKLPRVPKGAIARAQAAGLISADLAGF